MNNSYNSFIKSINPLSDSVKGLNALSQCLAVLACIIFYAGIISFSAPVYAETIITNTATANYSINGTTHQLSDSVQFTKDTVVTPSDVITLSKQASTPNVSTGDTLTYTLTVANPNNHALNNVRIQDTLPAGLNFQAGTAKLNNANLNNSQVTYSGSQLSFTLGNMPANTSWTVTYDVDVNTSGAVTNRAVAESDTATSSQAQATVNVALRTPSTITFLKINENGTNQIIRPTAYNNNQSGGTDWQEVNTITLADGSTVSLPNPQPLIDASQYSLLDPIVIQLEDLDQNTDPNVIETVIVTVTVPGTNDTEVLLLQETSPNSGIFRGILLTTSNPASVQDGVLSLQEGNQISVNYQDAEDQTDTTATAALVVLDTGVALTKTADKETASISELVRYTLKFRNSTNFSISNLKLVDTLPLGFRYMPNTASLNGALLNSGVTTNGRTLNMNLGDMAVGQVWTIEYLTKITAGVQIGKAINNAYLSSDNFKSNIAHATVVIKDDLMRSKSILTGRVYIGCETGKNAKVLKDARIFNETGRSVLSDEEGFWHMEGVQAGVHVLQLDELSLSTATETYEPIICQGTTRHAGNARSQFVTLQAGSLWHVDFHVTKSLKAHPPTFTSSKQNTLDDAKEIDPSKTYGKEYLKTAPEGFDILWPKDNFVPAVASTRIIIKSSPQHKVELLLNGEKVSPLNYDGSSTNESRTVTIRRWKGVDININNRNNRLLVILKDKSGKEIARKTRTIHFSGEPASAEFLPEESILVADGKTIPVIALRIKDQDGFPMRANTHGYFSLGKGPFQVKTLSETKDVLNLNESLGGNYKYHIEENGIARIELNPTTQSGEVELIVKFANTNNKKSKTIKAWLKPQLRDWILVGLAEGTIAHKTVSGNMKTLTDLNKSDDFYKRGRVAFYAKGQIKGKYLLTVAYDTHKAKQEVGSQLNGNIDPDAWYTIYGDNSNNQYNAPSSRKLYLKIEKENFYAVFGDFNTGLTVTELAKYERTLNGIKSEYKGKRYSYNAFISETSNNHHHEEIPGDGTSGLYHLSKGVVPNSETIKIEVRDRFHSEQIIQSRTLSRYQDYDIDYNAGTLFFKFPITGRDRNFNPQLIIVDYDSETDNNKEIVAGGRVAVTTDDDKLEVGLSAIHIGKDKAKDDSLVAIDARYKITKDTVIRAEIAQSKTAKSQYNPVNAEILELEKQIANMEARLFYSKQDENFGIDSQASESGTKKIGAEVNYKINDKTSINAEISQQDNLSNDNKRQLAEVGVKHRYEQVEVNAGLRHSKEKLADAGVHKTVTNDTILVGGSYTTKNGKVTYRANIEENINSSSSTGIEERSPNRKTVGVDIKITEGMSVFAEHELTETNDIKTQSSRVGVSQSLWKGAKAKTTYTKERTDQGQRDYATLGLSQRVKISKYLHADISVDHAKTIKGSQKRFNENEPEVQGSQRDDYTAFSVGMGSQIKDWSWSGRFELREGDITDKTNLNLGLIHQLKNGKQVSAKFDYNESEDNLGNFEKTTKLSIGTAWHPKEKDFVFFSRLDLIDEKSNVIGVDATNTNTKKVVHNMHYNHQLNKKTQISLHHGIKHVISTSEQTKHKTTIDTGTVEIRRDISKKWDIGARAGYLHDWSGGTTETVAGVSIGVTPAKNARLEAGYNFEGFDDDDFDDNNYKRKGAFLSFEYKFDQNSFSGKDLPVRRSPKDKEQNQTKTTSNPL